MDTQIVEIAQRLKAMREMCDFTIEEMAEVVGKTPEEYAYYESGEMDFGFTFLYKCADKFGIDMVELLTGTNPHLSECTLVRNGQGLPMKRRLGFEYQHLASTVRDRISEPFVVIAPYIEEDQNAPVHTSTHEGQEFDYVLSGTLRFVHDGHEMTLNPGDSVYYNSARPHGMVATSKDGCKFIAIVMRGEQ